MKCDEARELLSEYLHGELDHGLRAAVKDHLGVCGQCRTDAVLLEKTWAMLDDLPVLDAPANLRHDVVVQAARLKFQRENMAKPKGKLLSVIDLFVPDKQRQGIAAAIAAAIVLAFFLKLPQSALNHFTGGIEAIHAPKGALSINKDVPEKSDGDPKSMWMARRTASNTLWVNIDRKLGGNDKMLCSVTLTVNPEAFLPNVGTRRMNVNMHLLQNSAYGSAGLQSGDPVWQGVVQDGAPVMVPVILDRTGDSVELLVTWRYGSRDYAQVVFIPSMETAIPDGSSGVSIGDCKSMYSFMEAVAGKFGVPVVAGLPVCRRPVSINAQSGTLKEILGSTLTPSGLDWLSSEGVIYIDKALDTKE